MQFYDIISSYYDKWVMNDAVLNSSKEYYIKELSARKGEVLEIGIGTGRIGIELAKSGIFLTGIDSSHKMIDICRKRYAKSGAQGTLTLQAVDILEMKIDRQWDTIILPLRTIGCFEPNKNVLLLFQKVLLCLKEGGEFLFDHFNCNFHRESKSLEKRALLNSWSENGSTSHIYHTWEFDPKAQVFDSVLEVETCKNKKIKKIVAPYKLYWLSPIEIQKLSKLAGFSDCLMYGSFDKEVFSESSKEIVVKCIK